MNAVVVTGGSRGIGAATAVLAAQSGYSVVVNYKGNKAAASQVVEKITASGGRAIAVAGDVGEEADVIRLFDTAISEFGQIDALVNNAGILEPHMPLQSIAAKLGSPNEYVDYAATKGAIDTFTIGLATEVAGFGIRVNAVRPGVIYTEIHASGGEPERVDRVKQSVPMKRGGTADEVAQAILWLMSRDASYTTGAFIDVSGGR